MTLASLTVKPATALPNVDLPVEYFLRAMASQRQCTFHAAGQVFTPEQIFSEEEFSLVPLVVLQAVRIGLPMGRRPLSQMALVGALSAPDPKGAAGISVLVRPVRSDDLALLRTSLYQQAAEEVFGWRYAREIDLATIYQAFGEGYELERAALKAYTAHQLAVQAEVPERRTTEKM